MYGHTKPSDGHQKPAYVHPKTANGDFTQPRGNFYYSAGRNHEGRRKNVSLHRPLLLKALQTACAALTFTHSCPKILSDEACSRLSTAFLRLLHSISRPRMMQKDSPRTVIIGQNEGGCVMKPALIPAPHTNHIAPFSLSEQTFHARETSLKQHLKQEKTCLPDHEQKARRSERAKCQEERKTLRAARHHIVRPFPLYCLSASSPLLAFSLCPSTR